MRTVMVLGFGLLGCTVPAWADEIYQWTDAGGGVHYTNTPSEGGSPTRVNPDEPATAAAAPEDDPAFSTGASLRRNALERDVRATGRRLHELDGRLGTLARARTGRANGSDATGGLGTLAGDLRSEEEKALAAERDQVAQHARDLQSDYGKLREEVTTRLGRTPEWWVDVRFDRH